MQAHFGAQGFTCSHSTCRWRHALYLFDGFGRTEARKQLAEDISAPLTDFGDAVGVGEFYSSILQHDAAHMDDVHAAIIEQSRPLR